MNHYSFTPATLLQNKESLTAGDKILLSGTIFTARDAAHKRFFEDLNNLPFDIKGSIIYFAGPTPAFGDFCVGSIGPTTSSRMDSYSPTLYNMGLLATIGKGDRSPLVYSSIINNKVLYLCAIGGAGALYSHCVTDCRVIAYEDLGCESVKELTVKDFPLYVGIDTHGNSLFVSRSNI